MPSKTQILKEVKKNCMKGFPIPKSLETLWDCYLNEDSFLKQVGFSNIELVSELDNKLFKDYTASKCGDKALANAYTAMFDQIAFFGKENEGELLGLWLYGYNITPENAPMIYIDVDGKFSVFESIPDYLFWDVYYSGHEDNKQLLLDWFKQNKILFNKTIKQVEKDVKKIINPETIFNELIRVEKEKLKK